MTRPHGVRGPPPPSLAPLHPCDFTVVSSKIHLFHFPPSMNSSRLTYLLIALLLSALAALAYHLYNTPARVTARLARKTVACVEKGPDESLLLTARKTSALKEILAPSVTCSAPSLAISATYPRDDLVAQILAARNELATLGILIDDLTVELPDPTTSVVTLQTTPVYTLPSSSAPGLELPDRPLLATLTFRRADRLWHLFSVSLSP